MCFLQLRKTCIFLKSWSRWKAKRLEKDSINTLLASQLAFISWSKCALDRNGLLFIYPRNQQLKHYISHNIFKQICNRNFTNKLKKKNQINKIDKKHIKTLSIVGTAFVVARIKACKHMFEKNLRHSIR